MRALFNGSIIASQAIDAGSIPVARSNIMYYPNKSVEEKMLKFAFMQIKLILRKIIISTFVIFLPYIEFIHHFQKVFYYFKIL